MTVKVKVPAQLRTLTDGASEISGTGHDVGGLIKDLDARYPGLGERLLDDSGKLRRFVNIYVNDEDVRFLDSLGTPLPEGAQVSIIPAVAGG